MTTVPREWDAHTYDRVSTPQERWGTPVVDRLVPDGVEVVLDAGCGTGRVTQRLLRRLPDVRVVAVDGSRRMLDEAAERLASEVKEGRVTFVQADLSAPLPLDRPVDAVISTATFHWIADHDALFANLAEVMRPGAQLVAQYGGAGNIDSVVKAMREVGEEWTPWTFSTPGDAAARLRQAGFVEVEAWLHDEPTAFETDHDLREFLTSVVLGEHLARRAEHEHAGFVQAVAARLPSLTIDYVRLNVVARRGP